MERMGRQGFQRTITPEKSEGKQDIATASEPEQVTRITPIQEEEARHENCQFSIAETAGDHQKKSEPDKKTQGTNRASPGEGSDKHTLSVHGSIFVEERHLSPIATQTVPFQQVIIVVV